MIRPYIIDPLEFSFGQALSQISVDENLSTTEELERVLGWYFEEVEKGLYRPSETLRNCAKETIPGKENQ